MEPKNKLELKLSGDGVEKINEFLGVTGNAEKYNLVDYKSAYQTLVGLLNEHLVPLKEETEDETKDDQ